MTDDLIEMLVELGVEGIRYVANERSKKDTTNLEGKKELSSKEVEMLRESLRAKKQVELTEEPEERIRQQNEPHALEKEIYGEQRPSASRTSSSRMRRKSIRALNGQSLRTAMIQKEILDKPLSLR